MVYMHPARQLERRREARGDCIKCGTPTPGVPERKRVSGRAPTQHICRPCLDKRSAIRTVIDHRRVKIGLCVRCGVPLVNRTVRECAHCRSRERYWYAKRNGKPLPEILPARTPPPARTRTLMLSAGTKPSQLRAVAAEPAPGFHGDKPLTGRPERPCSCCGRKFAPTLRRRRLCLLCYSHGRDDAA